MKPFEPFTDGLSSGSLPLHVQLAEMITRDIKAGVLADGERLPPEREMAEQLAVAVGTLRRALADLEAKGMLERVQGSGNYVRNSVSADNVYALFRLELIHGGGFPSAELLSVRRLKKPVYLPEYGNSPYGFRFRRLRSLNGRQAACEEIWLDGSYAESIDKADVSESLYVFYKESLGFWITRAEDRVGVAKLPDWAPSDLVAKETTHWGYVERLSRDNEGRTAEYSRTWFDPENVRFVSR